MLSKIDLTKIVKDHLSTLKHHGEKRKSKSDIFLFYGTPIILLSIVLFKNFTFTEEQINILITVFSIFTGLLLNLLLLIYDIVLKISSPKLKEQFLKEIYSNISYTILLAIVIIILLFISCVNSNFILSSLAVALILQFVLTLLMILKRVHILLSKEING